MNLNNSLQTVKINPLVIDREILTNFFNDLKKEETYDYIRLGFTVYEDINWLFNGDIDKHTENFKFKVAGVKDNELIKFLDEYINQDVERIEGFCLDVALKYTDEYIKDNLFTAYYMYAEYDFDMFLDANLSAKNYFGIFDIMCSKKEKVEILSKIDSSYDVNNYEIYDEDEMLKKFKSENEKAQELSLKTYFHKILIKIEGD